MSLLPCPNCARHVNHTNASCPFCSTKLEARGVATSSAALNISRAALLAAGAALTVAACSESPIGGGASDAGKKDSSLVEDSGGQVALYGAPAPVDSGVEDTGTEDDASDLDSSDDAAG